MEQAVPWIPLFSTTTARIVSARVAAFSFDQSMSWPALDRIALKPAVGTGSGSSP